MPITFKLVMKDISVNHLPFTWHNTNSLGTTEAILCKHITTYTSDPVPCKAIKVVDRVFNYVFALRVCLFYVPQCSPLITFNFQ